MQRYFVVSLCLSWLAVTGIALAHTISAQALDRGAFPWSLEVTRRGAAVDSLRTCDPSWQVVPSANVGSLDNYLTAVTALAPTDVWAVGYYTGTGRYLSLTEHWDGAQWSIVPSPNPGAYNNVLRGVTAISAGDAWAVGDYNNSYDHPTRHLLTPHWDGVQWNVVPNPDPGGNYDNSINSVKAFVSDDVWAVGFIDIHRSMICACSGTECNGRFPTPRPCRMAIRRALTGWGPPTYGRWAGTAWCTRTSRCWSTGTARPGR